MKKAKLLLFMLAFALVFAVGGCTTGVNVNDSTLSSSSSSSVSIATSYTLTVGEVTNGTVTIQDDKTTAKKGDIIVLNVTPNQGYKLVWLKINDGNNVASSVVDGKLYYRVDYDIVITAYFDTPQAISSASSSVEYIDSNKNNQSSYVETFSINVLNSNGGIVSVSKVRGIEKGELIKFSSIADSGYEIENYFANRSDNGEAIQVTDGTFVMPNCNVTVGGNFKQTGKTISVATCQGGTVSVDKNLANVGETVKLSSVADRGYQLSYYTLNGEELSSNTFEVVGDSEVGAVFEKINYNISVNSSNFATVNVSATATYQEQVTVSYTAQNGYKVDTITVNTKSGIPVVIANNKFTMPDEDVVITVTTVADVPTYAVSVSAVENGSVTADVTSAIQGQTVTLTVQSDIGYELKSLTVTSGEDTIQTTKDGNNYTFTMPSAGVTVSAEFVKVNYTFTVTFSGAGDKTPQTHTETLNYGDAISYVVPQLEGYTCSYQAIASTMPAEDYTVVVTYTVKSYTLTINYSGAGENTPSTYTASVEYGKEYSVVTPTIAGYISDRALVSGIMGAQDVTVNVTYTEKTAIYLTIIYVGAGENTPSQYQKEVTQGEEYSVTSPSVTGYTPDIAVVEGTIDTTDVIVTVTYTINTYKLTITYTGLPSGNTTHTETVNYGASYTVTTPEVAGYTPDKAVVSGTVGASDISVTVTYTANTYTLTITYTGLPSGDTTHTETVNYGASYSVTSPTVTGYTPDTAVVSGTVGTSDINVTVTYTINSYKLTITYTGASVATHTETLNYGASYSVTSPTVTGYKPDKAVVEGTIGTSDVSVTVTYSVQTYVLTINHVCGDKILKTETQNVVFGQTATVNAQTITGYTASANSKTFTMDAEGKTVSYDYTVNSHTLTVIHNIYGGGTYSATETSTVNYGATYTASPKSVNGYIVVDKGAQSGTMPDNDVTVTFTYSLNTSATGVGENTVIPAISVITANTGFSITYTHTGATNDWYYLFTVGNVKVYNGCIELVDGSGAVTASMYDGQHGGGYNSVYGMSYNWDAVVPYSETHTYTISFDTNGAIAWYKDGVRVLLFNTSSTNNAHGPSSFVSSAISGIQTSGITVQTGVDKNNTSVDSTITNVKVGYAQTVKAVTVTYSFNDGTVKQPSVYNMIDGYTYTVNNKMYGYTASADTSAISTSANATVSYTRASANSETLIDGDKTYTKELGTEMLAGVKRISGDFYIEIGLKDVVQMQASPNAEGVEQWWQTVLVEIQQSDAQENRFFRVDRYSWNPYGTWGHWTQGNVWWNNDANLYYQVMKNSSNITIKITRSGATVNVVYEIVSSATGGTYYMNFICENMAQTVDVGIGAEWSTFTLDYLKMECDRQATTYGKNYGGWTDTTGNYLIGTFSKTVASSQTVFIHQTGCIGIDSTAAWGDACWRTALIVLEGNGQQGLAGRADWCGWGVDGVYSAPVVTHDYNDQYHTGGAYELFVSANIAITVSSDGAGKLNVTYATVPDRGPSIGKLITVNYSYDLYVDSINAYIGAEWATFKLSHQVFL